MESKLNLSLELCEKVLTIFLLELNQTSKVNPAEKYYFKNLNQLLQISSSNFQRIKKESATFRPPNPQDRMMDLGQFFQETLTTLKQVYSAEESEDILKLIIVSMDCSSHFTMESLDTLLEQFRQEQPVAIIEDEGDFFTELDDSSDFDIIEEPDEAFNFIEEESDDPILPPSIELSSPQTIALPKSTAAGIENFDDVLQEDPPIDDVEDHSLQEPPVQESSHSHESETIDPEEESLDESLDTDVTIDENEGKVKKKKFKLPKISFDGLIPAISKHLQKPTDTIIDKLKLSNPEDVVLTHPKLRALAAIIDVLTFIPCFIVLIPVTMILATVGLGIVGLLVNMALSFLFIFYYYKAETSSYQGTLGKVLCKIKIVNHENQVMTNKQALTRNLFRFSPMLLSNVISIILMILPLGFLGLLSALASLAVTIGICYAFFNKKRQGVHDILAKSYVIGINHDLPDNLDPAPSEIAQEPESEAPTE